ncbi:MAG: hypothetical protein LLF76_08170 [Planctomycetaceae bacterium]|nr:hypothetical protein [Planctomycetaceae bacterium]
MSVTLAYALGTSELIVGRQPRQMSRRLDGYAGADGLTGMNLGTRGYVIPIILTLRAAGASYAAARATMEAYIYTVELLQDLDAAEYTYGSITYSLAIWERPLLVPVSPNSLYRYDPRKGIMTCRMSIILRGLL